MSDFRTHMPMPGGFSPAPIDPPSTAVGRHDPVTNVSNNSRITQAQKWAYMGGQTAIRTAGFLLATGANFGTQYAALNLVKDLPKGLLAAGVLGAMSTNATKSYLFPILDQLVPQMKYAEASDGSLYSQKERIYKIIDQLLDAAAFAGGVVANSYGRAGVEGNNNLLTGGANPAIAFAHFLLANPRTLLAIAAVPAALDAVLHYMPNAAVAATTADRYESYEAKPWKERLSKIGDILKSAAHWNFKGPKETWSGNVDHAYRSLNLGVSTGVTVAISLSQKTLPYLQLNPMAAIVPAALRLGQATARDWTIRRQEHRARPADLETGAGERGRVLGELNEHGHIVGGDGNATGVFQPTLPAPPQPVQTAPLPAITNSNGEGLPTRNEVDSIDEHLPPIVLPEMPMPAATTTRLSHPVIMPPLDIQEPVQATRSAPTNPEDLARAIGIESEPSSIPFPNLRGPVQTTRSVPADPEALARAIGIENEPPSITFSQASGPAPASLSAALGRLAGRARVEPTSLEMTTFPPKAESSRTTANPVGNQSRAQTLERSRSVSPTLTEPEITSTVQQPQITLPPIQSDAVVRRRQSASALGSSSSAETAKPKRNSMPEALTSTDESVVRAPIQQQVTPPLQPEVVASPRQSASNSRRPSVATEATAQTRSNTPEVPATTTTTTEAAAPETVQQQVAPQPTQAEVAAERRKSESDLRSTQTTQAPRQRSGSDSMPGAFPGAKGMLE